MLINIHFFQPFLIIKNCFANTMATIFATVMFFSLIFDHYRVNLSGFQRFGEISQEIQDGGSKMVASTE